MNASLRVFTVSAAIVAAIAAPALAAPPTQNTAGETISFDQYRDWRLHFIDQRQTQLSAELAEKNLAADRRIRLERQKAYYDYFAAMAPAERDRRFRERFDQIDVNHDSIIDRGERTAWHDKQRAFYEHGGNRREAAANTARRP